MISLIKIAVLGATLVIAGCHIDGTRETGHDEYGNALTANGKLCITPVAINVHAMIVSSPVHDVLLEKLGFDLGIGGLNVYTTDTERTKVGIQVTDISGCLLFLGEVSRTELARMLGIKTFGGIDQ